MYIIRARANRMSHFYLRFRCSLRFQIIAGFEESSPLQSSCASAGMKGSNAGLGVRDLKYDDSSASSQYQKMSKICERSIALTAGPKDVSLDRPGGSFHVSMQYTPIRMTMRKSITKFN
jgi:hypothetical protein